MQIGFEKQVPGLGVQSNALKQAQNIADFF